MNSSVGALIVAALVFAGPSLRAETDWLPVIGDRTNPDAETVEVDVMPLHVEGSARVMSVRTSRRTDRVNWDGVPYRSYQAVVIFDCLANTVRFQEIQYFLQPSWGGPITTVKKYGPDNPRWMRFRDMSPNPTDRIIRAACSIGKVKNVS